MQTGAARIRYRVGQGWGALAGRVDPDQRAAAMIWLPPAARSAFAALPRADQRHHLAVFGRLWARGCRDADLLAAALLHDIGKVDGRRRVWLWQRTTVVLLRRWPALLDRLSALPAPAWRYGFYLLAHHPALGAAQAARLGCSSRAVALIAAHAAHQSPASEDPDLALLQAADDAS
jgi:hypothetical protein